MCMSYLPPRVRLLFPSELHRYFIGTSSVLRRYLVESLPRLDRYFVKVMSVMNTTSLLFIVFYGELMVNSR